MALEEYREKRDFQVTSEPPPRKRKGGKAPIFVVQEHHASTLHYDFRLEADGVLKSWAVPKGPSLDPAEKRLAVQVEDHPVEYANFAGDIPEGQYGAGHVVIWDHGTYEVPTEDGTPPRSVSEAIGAGRLEFVLHGERLKGKFALIRMGGGRSKGKPQWLLIKSKDEHAEATPAATARALEVREAAAVPKANRPKGKRPKEIEPTHPDRVLFPEANLTKGDVLDFYRQISPQLLPFLKDRPATLERLPEGLGGEEAPHFWQKNTPDYYPDWIARAELSSEKGKAVHYALVNNVETLLYLVNQGTLTFHVWASRLADLDRPDFVLFDLDPGKASFGDVVDVALALKRRFDADGIAAFVKTSGKSGLHVLTPWDRDGDYDEARAWALEVGGRVVAEMPERATVEVRKAKRGRRVYIDVLQNARGHHAVPPYVLRSIPRGTVSTPLDWAEVTPSLDPAAFTTRAILDRIAGQKRDPWKGLIRRQAGSKSAKG